MGLHLSTFFSPELFYNCALATTIIWIRSGHALPQDIDIDEEPSRVGLNISACLLINSWYYTDNTIRLSTSSSLRTTIPIESPLQIDDPRSNVPCGYNNPSGLVHIATGVVLSTDNDSTKIGGSSVVPRLTRFVMLVSGGR